MSVYVLCVLGGMALLACLQFGARYINGLLADWRWERREQERREREQAIKDEHQRKVDALRIRGWSDPAVKGFLRACVRAHEERKHDS